MFDLNEVPNQNQDAYVSQPEVHLVDGFSSETLNSDEKKRQERNHDKPSISTQRNSSYLFPNGSSNAYQDTSLCVDEGLKASAIADAPVEGASATMKHSKLFSSFSLTFDGMKTPLVKREDSEPLFYQGVSAFGDVVKGKTDDHDNDLDVKNDQSTPVPNTFQETDGLFDSSGHQTRKTENLLQKNQDFLDQSNIRTQILEDSLHLSNRQNKMIKSEDILHQYDHKRIKAFIDQSDNQTIKNKEFIHQSDEKTEYLLRISDDVDNRTLMMSETSTATRRIVNQEKKGQQIVPESCTFNLSLSTDLMSLPQKNVSDLKSYGADMLTFSLGCASELENTDDLNISSSLKAVKTLDLAPRKSKETPLTLKQCADLSPFWNGKLRCIDEDAVVHIPVVAFCMGIMKPDSRLKKIPAMLNAQKFVKLEELEISLRNGIAEPLIQFKPSLDASIEEVMKFKSMIKAMINGIKAPSQLASGLGSEGPSAVLISWDDDNSATNFYLLSSTGLQVMLKNCQSDILHSDVEKLGVVEPYSFYGVLFYNAVTNKHYATQRVDQNAGRNITISTNRKDGALTCIASETEKRSCNRNHAENLNTNVAMEPKHVSTREKLDSVNGENRSRKCYRRQSSVVGIANESKSKYNYEHDNRVGNSCDEQSDQFNLQYGRNFERHELQCDKLKDTIRSNKGDGCLSNNQIKEYQRHTYFEAERLRSTRAYEGKQWNQDEGWLKLTEKEKLSKDNMSTELNKKRVDCSKNDIDPLCNNKLDTGSTKSIKKRDREEEKYHIFMKRTRESQGNVIESEQVKNTDVDLRPNINEINMDYQSQRVSKLVGKMVSTNLNMKSRQIDDVEVKCLSSHAETDDVSKTMNANSYSGEMVKHQMEGAIMEEKRGDNRGLIFGDNSNVLQMRGEILEDETPSKLRETLFESPFIIVDKDGKKEPYMEFLVDVLDKETRTWLLSKQNALYFHEDYGVHTIINTEALNSNSLSKADSQKSPLHVRISMATPQSCDPTEAMWFIDQAACMIKSISMRGVFIKCIWYEGPVQLQPGDNAPSVSVIVKKIKGDDGKNLERIQDMTGVMVGVVLRKSNTAVLNEVESTSHSRFIGLRLKCIRRKGLLDASRKAETLLENVADHFSKELAMCIATRISDLQESSLHHIGTVSNQDSRVAHVIHTKELLPNPPSGGQIQASSSDFSKIDGIKLGVLHEDDGMGNKSIRIKEDCDEDLPVEKKEPPSKSLYVSNIPAHATSIKIQNIFESVLKEKLKTSDCFDGSSQLVVDVRYFPDKLGATVELANCTLVHESLKLFTDDRSIFHGLRVEKGTSVKSRIDQPSLTQRSGATNTRNKNGEDSVAPSVVRTKSDAHEGRKEYGLSDNDSDSDYFRNLWYGNNTTSKNSGFLDKPRPLFVSELMRNASAQTIKELFEDILDTYIGPALVNSSGKQLVLDVRYVPSRGCAFVDLATPQLVDFMLDLHTRRPEVFLNMKMELGRRPVPYSIEDDSERKLNSRNWDGMFGKSHYGSQSYEQRLASIGSRKIEKRCSGSHHDYMEDTDTGDDLLRQNSRVKKLRSDPEKTIYADRLPENASEAMLKGIFERVLLQNMSSEELETFGDELITEVRYIPSKYCAFIVFIAEELTRMILNIYNQNEDAFENMRLKPHFHSRMEDLYKEDLHGTDDTLRPSFRERLPNLEVDDYARPRKIDSYDCRNQSTVHRAITASAFKEVNRRKSVYVDRIPEELSEYSMTDMFEKVLRNKKHGYEGYMVAQVAYFRDKFDSSKLCAFVELNTEEGTQDLVDFYNANPDAFQGVRVRPGFKYSR